MPFFTYTALREGKNVVNGKIEAASLREARELLRKQNLVPTKVTEQGAVSKEPVKKTPKNTVAAKKEKEKEKVAITTKLSLQEKIDFTNSLYILIKTGIPLVEALLFIEVNTSSKGTQKLTTDLRRMLLLGSNFSDAVLKHPETFDQLYAGIIKAGEESGELEFTLGRLVDLLHKQDRLKSRLFAALIYPCFIVLLAILVSTVMITFVFPAFKDTYAQMGHELPWITQFFIDFGIFLKSYWFMIPLLIGSLVYSTHFVFTCPITRKQIDKTLLDIPVLSTFIKYVYLSNFISILRVCFDAGIPIIDSILLANKTVINYKLSGIFREVVIKIQQGQSLSASLRASNIIPGIIMCMISTGEESGQLDETLEQSELYIETQLDRTVETLNKLFEPILLMVIGCIVLTLALALYLPLFQNYANML